MKNKNCPFIQTFFPLDPNRTHDDRIGDKRQIYYRTHFETALNKILNKLLAKVAFSLKILSKFNQLKLKTKLISCK